MIAINSNTKTARHLEDQNEPEIHQSLMGRVVASRDLVVCSHKRDTSADLNIDKLEQIIQFTSSTTLAPRPEQASACE